MEQRLKEKEKKMLLHNMHTVICNEAFIKQTRWDTHWCLLNTCVCSKQVLINQCNSVISSY